MKTKNLIIFFLLVTFNLLGQSSTDQNYIEIHTKLNETGTKELVDVKYFDGLGRLVQTVQKGASPSQNKNIVTNIEFDYAGRKIREWLPIATDVNRYLKPIEFSNIAKSNYNDSKPYQEYKYTFNEYDRLDEIQKPGSDMQNKTTKPLHGSINNSVVKKIKVDVNNLLVNNGFYDAKSLTYDIIRDEDGKQTIEYKDKLGRVVMQRNGTNVDTYYVSNDLGQLCYVIPPLAADALEIGTYTETTEVVKKYGYVYKYDERGNCIYKKLPGCEPIYMAYDLADRLVQSQDGKQRVGNKWTVIKYDVFGRVVFTGSITDTSTNWAVLNSNTYQYKNTVIIETYTNGVYSNNYFVDAIPLMSNYYDNYSFISNLPSTIQTNLKYTVNTGYSKAYPETATDISSLNAKGMLTGTLVYLLDGSNKYSVVLNYYDDKGRIVQTRSTNHLGGYDIAYNDLDFTGKPNKTLKEHNIAGGNTISELYTYTYDHIGRVIKTDYTLNEQPSVTLADMTNGYDELGRLKQKKRHNGADTESFQYNIRNWISKITSGGFEENLFYNTKPSIIEQATPCYNGNICYSTWTYNDATRGYEYEYDELNRFTGGYAYNNNEMLVDYQYSEWFNYNKMGNITHLLRHGDGGEFYDLDNLSFTYDGNQLTNIEDENEPYNLYNVKEYQDKASEYNELEYDVNGNLIKDLDREIVTIKYNSLNLPEIVQFKNGNMIKNLYNAGGQKLRSDYYTRLTTITPLAEGEVLEPIYTPTDYSYNGTVYIDNKEYKIIKLRGPIIRGKPIVYKDLFTLNLLYNSEGYVTTVTSPQYFYYRKDHLGNNREVWCGNTNTTVQRTQYYPSGLPWAEGLNSWAQNKKYNGKEFVEAHGLDEYDSAARWYYPAIMRTTTLDPLAEKYYSISPYAWCGNNPVSLIDPTGMSNYHPETDENGNNKLVADIGDDEKSLINYLTTIYGSSDKISQSEWENLSSQLSFIQKMAEGDIAGYALFSKVGTFDNLVGKYLTTLHEQSPSFGITNYEGNNCSPTSFNRVDKAMEFVYGKDILGALSMSNPLYSHWQGVTPKNASSLANYAPNVISNIGYGTLLNKSDILNGALKPGAILDLSQTPGPGNLKVSWHSAIFLNYNYDSNGTIVGLTYWHHWTYSTGQLQNQYESISKFGFNNNGIYRSYGYEPFRAVNFK